MDSNKLISLILLEKALEDLGLYPASVSGGDNPYTERTPYMNGYNDCQMELTRRWSVLSNYIGSLPAEYKEDIQKFIVEDKLQLSADNDKVKLWVNCNDLFYWACSDGEDFTLEDLADFKRALEESPENGDILWCCRKRGMRPQEPYYKYFSPEEKILFDAAGPKRDE